MCSASVLQTSQEAHQMESCKRHDTSSTLASSMLLTASMTFAIATSLCLCLCRHVLSWQLFYDPRVLVIVLPGTSSSEVAIWCSCFRTADSSSSLCPFFCFVLLYVCSRDFHFFCVCSGMQVLPNSLFNASVSLHQSIFFAPWLPTRIRGSRGERNCQYCTQP